MSAHMKKRLTKAEIAQNHSAMILHMTYMGICYDIPKIIAEKYKVSNKHKDHQKTNIPADEIFAELDKEFSKAGALLKGLRYREGLTQNQFAKKIGIRQSDLSKMENGKRPIGKTIAKRIEKKFDVNYRRFLE